ncbi:MAG: TIGR03936 family radical SAM-associated protein [Clostridia bacterium]
MLQIRVFFKKKNAAKYISHLDLQRTVMRGLMRSNLKIAYSEGFNPHIKLAFAMPLSVFQESDYEIFDIQTLTDYSKDEIKSALIKAFPPDIMIFNVAEPIEKLAALKTADYDITLFTTISALDISAALDGDIIVEKRTKSGIKAMDISSLIYKKSIEKVGDFTILHLNTACNPVDYLNVAYVVTYLKEKFGDNICTSEINRTMLRDVKGNPLA